MSRQVPGLPHTTAGSKKQPKKNTTGIDGRILDPIARRAAQRAAKLEAMRLAAVEPEEDLEQVYSLFFFILL